MVFWAWSEHKKAIQRFKDAGRAEAAKEYEPKLAELAKERDALLAAADARQAQLADERQAQLIDAAVTKALDARLGAAAREREDSLAAAWERAKADGIDMDKYLKP